MTTIASNYLLNNKFNPSSVTHCFWRTVFGSIQGMEWRSSKGQFIFLADITAEVLLNHNGVAKNADLILLLQELTIYVERQRPCNLLKSLLSKAERLATIDGYYGRLTELKSFQLSVSTSTRYPFSEWKDSFNRARKLDQDVLNQILIGLNDQPSMVQMLGFDGTNAVPIMACLQRYINDKSADEQEISVINIAISYISLSASEDRVVDVKPWTITAFDVDIGPLLGAGSLGKVFRGRWNSQDVAIKMLKTRYDITPRSVYLVREIGAWSKLHHPNVLPFLGGNTLDNEPFIVCPFLKHKTCRDYIQKHPGCNRLRLLYETSLGLSYLHSQKIIHGNLNGSNILVDDAGKAQLCDYGLAEIKADINSRSPIEPACFPCIGSLNWMAPELFTGGELTFECDIYSFGMTIYEMFTGHIPFGYVPLNHLYTVLEKNIRPEWPKANEAARFPDEAWVLAAKCWEKYPLNRIQLSTLAEQLAAMLLSSAGDELLDQPASINPILSVVPQVSQPIGL